MRYTFDQQMEVQAIVVEFIQSAGDTFSPAKALRLKEIIINEAEIAASGSSLKVRFDRPNSSKTMFEFAGVPEGAIQSGETKTTEFKMGRSEILSASHWDISWNKFGQKTCLNIKHRFNSTKSSEDVELYILKYDAQGRPTCLEKMVTMPRIWAIPFIPIHIELSVYRPVIFKTPSLSPL